MRVTMNVSISGTRGDGTEWPARGEAIDVSDGEGSDLIAAGLATEGEIDAESESRTTGEDAAPSESEGETAGDDPKPKRATKRAAAKSKD